MAPIVLWTLVAFVVAVVVMVVAVAVAGDGGGRQFLSDLRAGLRREARRELFVDLRADADDADAESSVDELFTVGRPTETAYLDPDRLVRLGRGHH